MWAFSARLSKQKSEVRNQKSEKIRTAIFLTFVFYIFNFLFFVFLISDFWIPASESASIRDCLIGGRTAGQVKHIDALFSAAGLALDFQGFAAAQAVDDGAVDRTAARPGLIAFGEQAEIFIAGIDQRLAAALE